MSSEAERSWRDDGLSLARVELSSKGDCCRSDMACRLYPPGSRYENQPAQQVGAREASSEHEEVPLMDSLGSPLSSWGGFRRRCGRWVYSLGGIPSQARRAGPSRATRVSRAGRGLKRVPASPEEKGPWRNNYNMPSVVRRGSRVFAVSADLFS